MKGIIYYRKNLRPNIGNVCLLNLNFKKFLTLQLVYLSIIFIIPLAGCGQVGKNVFNEELEKNIRLWRNSRISNYNFNITKAVGTANFMPSSIKVRRGRVMSNEIIGTKPMTNYQEIKDFETVEEAFGTIQDAYNMDSFVNVRYNEEFGFPELISTSKKNQIHTVFLEISHFEIIEVD